MVAEIGSPPTLTYQFTKAVGSEPVWHLDDAVEMVPTPSPNLSHDDRLQLLAIPSVCVAEDPSIEKVLEVAEVSLGSDVIDRSPVAHLLFSQGDMERIGDGMFQDEIDQLFPRIRNTPLD